MTGRPSLYWRTIGILALVLGLAALGLGVAAWIYARRAADDAYDRLLIGAALQMAESIAVQDGVVDVDPPASAFETLALAPQDRIFYRVTDPAGRVLTGYDDLVPTAVRPGPVRAEPLVENGTYLGASVRLATVGLYRADAIPPGWAQVTVAQTGQARVELAGDLTAKALGLLAVMMALAFVGVLVAVRLALAPLRAIETTLQARSPKDLTPLAVQTPREIATLVGSIDFFMDRLQQQMAAMQRFIADAAHQIRTPLAALASQVDLLSNGNEDRRAHHLARLRDRTSELGRITHQLLNHAMVIHRTEAVPFGRVDLGALARQGLINAVPLTVERPVAVALEAPDDPVQVVGDAVSLREALSNLLHNAIKYGARTSLEIEVSRDGTWGVMAVIDDGPGIPEAEWADAGRPFSSRSETGTGLGLAIVTDVVRAHAGELAFAWRPQGFAVVIRLPLAGPGGTAMEDVP